MQLEKETPKKVQQILDSFPDTIPSKQKELFEESLRVFFENPSFAKSLNAINNISDCHCDSSNEDRTTLTLPVKLKQKEGRFDAEIEISLHSDEDLPEVDFNIVCADEILYDLPLDTIKEVDKFWRLKPSNYIPPIGTKIVYSEYLDRVYFAFLKNYYFMARYSPCEQIPVTFTQLVSLDSSKAVKSYPEYMPDGALAAKLGIKQHIGGTQIRKVKLNCDTRGKVLDKEISIETYFRVLREFRRYKITPQIRGCIIERTEEGTTNRLEHRSTSLRTVTKKVNIPFERLINMGDVHTEFERRCSKIEKSKLVAPKLHNNYESEKEKLKREDFELLGKKRFHENSREQIEQGRRPVDICSEKIKLNFQQNKILKEIRRDASVKYRCSLGHPFDPIDYVLTVCQNPQEDSVTTTIVKTKGQYASTITLQK